MRALRSCKSYTLDLLELNVKLAGGYENIVDDYYAPSISSQPNCFTYDLVPVNAFLIFV